MQRPGGGVGVCGVFGKENLVICRSRGGGGEPCAYGGPAGWGSSIRLAFSRPTCHRTSIFIFRSRLVGRRYPASFRTPSGVFYNQLTSHWFAATTAPTDPFTDPSFQTCLCFHRSDYGILATGWSSPTLNRPLGDLSSATYHRFISTLQLPYRLLFAGTLSISRPRRTAKYLYRTALSHFNTYIHVHFSATPRLGEIPSICLSLSSLGQFGYLVIDQSIKEHLRARGSRLK